MTLLHPVIDFYGVLTVLTFHVDWFAGFRSSLLCAIGDRLTDRRTNRHRCRLKPPSWGGGLVTARCEHGSLRFNDIQCITAISILSVVCTVGYLCVSVVCATVRVYRTSM